MHYISPKADPEGELIEICKTKGDLKQMRYASEIIDVLIDEVIKYKPNVGLIICGDLTYNGEMVSHIDLMKKLQKQRPWLVSRAKNGILRNRFMNQ